MAELADETDDDGVDLDEWRALQSWPRRPTPG
jgi:hypothetical protein